MPINKSLFADTTNRDIFRTYSANIRSFNEEDPFLNVVTDSRFFLTLNVMVERNLQRKKFEIILMTTEMASLDRFGTGWTHVGVPSTK